MNKLLIFAVALIMLIGCSWSHDSVQDPLSTLKNGKFIDLTWSFDEQSVYWPTNIPFKHETVFDGINDKGYYYSSFKYSAEEHGGTHFDSPMHFAEGGNSIEKVPVEQLTGEGVVVDVTPKAAADRDYQVMTSDFEAWEKTNGRIPDGAIVLINTGFGKFYPDKLTYTGTVLTGKEGVENLHFPGLHPDAAKWLATERKIKGVGLDTPSIDFGQSKEFLTHRMLFSHNLTAYENVAHLDELPPRGIWVLPYP